MLCGRYMGNSEPKQLEQNRIFYGLSKQLFFLACSFFSFGRSMICWRSSHILRNISTTFMTRIIYILSSWLLCRLRDREDILGCIMGLCDRQASSLHKHHQQWDPELHASSFQECDAKRRLGLDWRAQRTTLWITATPGAIGYFPTRAVSVANGVFFTTAYGSFNGSIYALDVKTGRVL